MSYHILLEGIYFGLSYSTHIWNAYVAGNIFKIQNRKNEAIIKIHFITIQCSYKKIIVMSYIV